MTKTDKTKTNKCEAQVCTGPRCARVRCELCSKSVHTKCANFGNTLPKLIGETPGLCWLCPRCRDPDVRKQQVSGATIDLILQRTTSSLTLIGALIDSMKHLSARIPYQPYFCPNPRRTDVPDFDRSLTEHFIDPPNFTNLLESILGEKRPRTSSVSRPSLSQPEKNRRVDVPIPQLIDTPTIDSPVLGSSNANGSSDKNNSHTETPTDETGASIPSALAAVELAVVDAINRIVADTTSSLPASTDQDATRAAEQAGVLSATSTDENAAAELAAPAAARQASAQMVPTPTAKHVADSAAQLAAAQASSSNTQNATTHAAQAIALALHEIAQKHSRAAEVRAATAPAAECAATNAARNQKANSTTTNAEPMDTESSLFVFDSDSLDAVDLAVAATPAINQPNMDSPQNWYYVTKFKPHETPDRLISYIVKKTKCEATNIFCHKLVRQGSSNKRPLTFLSFKLNVPIALEEVITAYGFWPAGVTIKPFLAERPRSALKSRLRPRAPSRPRTATTLPPTDQPVRYRQQTQAQKQAPLMPSMLKIPTSMAPALPQFLPQFHHYPAFPHYPLVPPMMNGMGLNQ